MTKNPFNIRNNNNFNELMTHRVHEILLVASPYDAFILEEDGKLTEQILSEYIGMNLSYAPRVWNAHSAKNAIEMIENRFFDIIIVMTRISDMDPIKFSKKIKSLYPKKPIVLLAFDQSEIKNISTRSQNIFDEIFIWSGNSNVFPALIKSIEDKKNISKDVKTANVRAIMFVEDTPRYYSSILPVLYRQIISNTKKLIDKSLNSSQKILHMRARPKIILVKNYEDAIKFIKKYRYNLLGIISDLRYPYKNDLNHLSGIKLIKYIKDIKSAIPILLQTTEKNIPEIIKNYSIKVIKKDSSILFQELQNFMIKELGFGEFEFRNKKDKILSRAANINELIENIKTVSDESLEFHSSKNHLSNWLSTRSEFDLANKFRIIRQNDFKTTKERRKYYLKTLSIKLEQSTKTKIVEFSKSINDFSHKSMIFNKNQ